MRPDHRLGVALRRILDGLLAARLPAIFASIALRLAWIALIVMVLGGAGQAGRTASSTPELAGTWLGTFWQVNAGDTDLVLIAVARVCLGERSGSVFPVPPRPNSYEGTAMIGKMIALTFEKEAARGGVTHAQFQWAPRG